MPSGVYRSRSGRYRSGRSIKKASRSNKRARNAARRRSIQRGSGIFDSIFSSKWLNWLDKKDPEEEKKNASDLATNKQTEMDKLDAKLAALQTKYPEVQDKLHTELAALRTKYPEVQTVKPSTLPPLGDSIPIKGGRMGSKVRSRRHRNRRSTNRLKASRHRRRA